jgi:TRAP-type mannitol/chloroaromatic compound transport system substrate-binding protein
MKRREFLKQAGTGALVSSALAAPAIAQGSPTVRWRMATSWPKSLDIVFASCTALSARVAELTDNKFQIQPFAGGEIVPALQVLDAVQNNTAECGSTLSAYFFGKRPAFAFDTGVAFGTNYRQQNAWMHHGGGQKLIRELFAKDGIVPFQAGNVGTQMGGFYRKEINTVDDLKGLKFRISGLGGLILTKLGVVPQQIPAGDIYAALERGTLDAAEMVGPYDDEKQGFGKVARFYYFPGWWEGSAQVTNLVNEKTWKELPKPFQVAFEVACNEQNMLMMSHYDAQNPAGLKRLSAQGVQFRSFSRPILDACFKASFQTFDELAAKDADFDRLYQAWKAFLVDSNLWFRVAEHSLDSYRYAASVTPPK